MFCSAVPYPTVLRFSIPRARTGGSAPGYFPSPGSRVMVVVRIRVRVSVNRVSVRMADGK